MSKFYQRSNPNPESSLFHHGLIRMLVDFHLVSTGDTQKGFLVRNGFLPLQIDPATNLTQGVEEPVSPKTSSHSLHDFRIEVQIQNEFVISPGDQTEIFSMTGMKSKTYEFIPKKPLEEVLSHLRNGSLNVTDQSQSLIPTVNEKFKTQCKQNRHLHEVCEVDFKKKRNG